MHSINNPKEYINKASGEGSYYIYSGKSRGGDTIIIKLDKRKKRPLYFLSNKPSYISNLAGIESQAKVNSINA